MILLENDYVRASFAEKGGELKNFFNKATGLEYIWNSDPAYWAKSSPILFPIVGALKDGTYTYQDKSYSMSRHGFARDLNFEVTEQEDASVCFSLTHNAETLRIYPFEFVLQLRYQLQETILTCTYEVYNPSDNQDLLFSIGGHPAFKVPLTSSGTYQDHFLKFKNDAALQYHHIKGNLIADETAALPLTDGRLPLHHDLFAEDALVFKNMKSDEITIASNLHAHGVSFSFPEFPFFGIWAATGADFVCLEPWCGIADGVHHDGMLEKKEGIIKLTSKKRWSKEWKLKCF